MNSMYYIILSFVRVHITTYYTFSYVFRSTMITSILYMLRKVSPYNDIHVVMCLVLYKIKFIFPVYVRIVKLYTIKICAVK